jgi:hypothetical protein
MFVVYSFKASHARQLLRWRHGKAPAIAQLLHLLLDMPSGLGRERLDEHGAVGERRGVQVHQLRDAVGDPIRRARNHEACVAVSEERDIMEILELDEVHHVGDMSV